VVRFSSRRFVNDERGVRYWIDANNTPQVYANLGELFPFAVYGRLESGFIGFAFHPEFARNGLFYTVHAERGPGNPKTPDFIPPGFTAKDVTYHNIITEWHATNPAAKTFVGTRRELLREAHVVTNLGHPMGTAEFNPTVKPGDPDYRLLYTSGSDHGFSNGGGPNSNTASQTQRLDSIMTAILRFDPRSPKTGGGVKGLGDYTIPMANTFAADGDVALTVIVSSSAVDCVETAVRNGDERVEWFRRNPRLASIRHDARFQQILQSIQARRPRP
jgi:hypothetical protein